MRNIFLLWTVLSVVPLVSACVAIPMVANMAAAGVLSKGKSERHAQKCYDIDTGAEKQKVSKRERNRRMTAANCPL